MFGSVVRIDIDRVCETRVGADALAQGPAVIGAGLDQVQFVLGAVAELRFPQTAVAVEGEALRVRFEEFLPPET